MQPARSGKVSAKNGKKPVASKKATTPKKGIAPRRGRGKSGKAMEDSEMMSDNNEPANRSAVSEVDEASQANESEEEEQDFSWEEYCYVCQDGGNVMCCEECPKVAHYGCVGFKTAPKGDWWCKDCTAKKSSAAQKKQATKQATSNVRVASAGRNISARQSAAK